MAAATTGNTHTYSVLASFFVLQRAFFFTAASFLLSIWLSLEFLLSIET